MGVTEAAKQWVNVASYVMTGPALRQVRVRAAQIARQRGSTRMGKVHLEAALDELAEVACAPWAEQPEYSCGCVVDGQHCPDCRAAARALHDEEEIPW